MILTLKFYNLPPMPRNRSHTLVNKGGRPMNIKTPLCREFESDLESRMKEFKAPITEFLSNFDKKKHYISGEYYLFNPKQELITKEGCISSRAVDTDAHKAFRDTIYRCMGIDDKLERDSRFFTPISHDEYHNVIVILKLENILCLTSTWTSSIAEQTSESLL